MSVTFVAIGDQGYNASASTSLLLPLPGGSGGLLVALITKGGTFIEISPPDGDGWNTVLSGSGTTWCLYYKPDSGSESGPKVFTHSSTSLNRGVIMRFSSAASIDAYDIVAAGSYTDIPTGSTVVSASGSGAVFAGSRTSATSRTSELCSFAGATKRADLNDNSCYPLWIWTADDVLAQTLDNETITVSSSGTGLTGISFEIVPSISSSDIIVTYRILGFNNNILLLGH